MTIPLSDVAIEHERDVVVGRQRARCLAELLGFDAHEQTRIATAVSEIARNAYAYAGGGRIEFSVEGESRPQLFVIRVADAGPGIADLRRVLSGEYRSPTGMGLGITGSKRLMDAFDVESSPDGTRITMRKLLPRGVPLVTPATAKLAVEAIARDAGFDPFAALRQQNAELLQTLDDLRRRQEELERLNAEMEDTNRGVVALYAELDERADHLRRADELKTRFLSNMSHEFRTPLNSILALSRLLLDRVDGPLTRAVKAGGICYLDEVVEARKDTTVIIHPLTDHRRVLTIDKLGEVVEAAEGFLLVVSYNPGYQNALKDLKHSTRQRFVALEFGFPEPDREAKIIAHEAGVDGDISMLLAKLGQKIRHLREHGLKEGASTRVLIYAARLIKEGIPARRACQVAVTWGITDDLQVQRALDEVATSIFP